MQAAKKPNVISDEMNLAEFPLSMIGERVPLGVDRLVFEDVESSSENGDHQVRRITVLGQEPFGLPTSVDDEVLMGCLRATKDAGFADRKVAFEPAAFLRSIQWKTDGPAYARLRRALDRYSTLSVISEGAYWNKGKKKPVRDVVGILDRWQSSGRDPDSGLPEKAFFVWGDFMWESFRAGNLRNLDYDFLLSLDSAVSRRAYRFLGKRFYRAERVQMGLKHFAVNKIGMSDKNHNGQIKATLSKANDELEEKGFCRAEYIGRGKDAQVVYHALEKKPDAKRDPLVAALRSRGVGGAAKLVESAGAKRVSQAIANYDHRIKAGESIGPGWLHECIAADQPYAFRDDYVTPQTIKQAQRRAEMADERRREFTASIRTDDENARNELRSSFEQFVGKLSETEYEQFREEAIAASTAYRKLLRKPGAQSKPHYATYLEAAMLDYWKRASPGRSDAAA